MLPSLHAQTIEKFKIKLYLLVDHVLEYWILSSWDNSQHLRVRSVRNYVVPNKSKLWKHSRVRKLFYLGIENTNFCLAVHKGAFGSNQIGSRES